MYGYIVPDEDELKVKELRAYQAHYCGLCHQIKKNYGQIERLVLSYDMTFVYLLLSSLYEPHTTLERKACFLHPIQKKWVASNDLASYVADMSIALAYLKLEDDVLDEPSFKVRVGIMGLKNDYKKVKAEYPTKIHHFEQHLHQLHILEKQECDDLDALSKTFGKVMGEVMVVDEDDPFHQELYDIGYYLGQFVYLMDAYDDLVLDIKHNRFNPLKKRMHDEHFKENYFKILELMMASCTEALYALPLDEHEAIIKNILYSGVWRRYKQIEQEEKDGSLSNSRNIKRCQ